jgi:agmatine deiminase
MTNPLNDGFTLPFEVNKHEGTIILLPYREDTWEDGGRKAFSEFKEIIFSIALYEHVYVIKSSNVKYDISELYNKENISIHELEYDDSWARDNTLIFLNNDNDEIRAVDFGFNAWGGNVDGLYANWDDDNKLGSKLAKLLNIDYYSDKDFILEGGSIHTNGNRTLLTTEACLLSKGRNSNLTKSEIEAHLKDMLGMDKVLWIPHGIYNDETNEHIDNMACFLDEKTVLLATTKDESDIQYKWSMEAKKVLEDNNLNVILVNCPNPALRLTKEEANSIILDDGAKPRIENDRLAGSYVNFYMGKDFIILPKFNVKEDIEAYNLLNDFYKGTKKIHQIESRKILVSGGNIHCITMQIGKGE